MNSDSVHRIITQKYKFINIIIDFSSKLSKKYPENHDADNDNKETGHKARPQKIMITTITNHDATFFCHTVSLV